MSIININISGTKETIDSLKKISNGFSNFSDPLEESSEMYLDAISENFNTEGKTFNKAWPPLTPATLAIKRALYNKGKSKAIKKPLVRTGEMKKSFDYDNTNNVSLIYNDMDYSILHQEGGTIEFNGKNRRLPQRILADVDDKRVNNIIGIFTKWIDNIIKKNKAD